MRLKDVVAELEHNLRVLDAYARAEIAELVAQGNTPRTCCCHICGKRDFMDNLADVGWMRSDEIGDQGGLMYSDGFIFAHPECAMIKKSDDGNGWVRITKGGSDDGAV